MEHPNTPSSPIAELVARARAAQRIYETWSQAQVDTAVVAAGWAIIEPAHNRELAELAVKDTGVGNVEDKVRKNHRKTFGLLRDLHGARSVGVITEDPARGIVEIARPVGVVCAITPSTNPGATPANKIINALKGRNAVIVAPSPKGWSTAVRLIEFIHQQFDRIGAPRDLVQLLPAPVNKQSTAELMRLCDVMLSFPAILVALLIAGVGRALFPNAHESLAFGVLIISISLTGWVQYARTVRGSTLVERNKEYVQAARVTGVSPLRIMRKHVLPNVLGPVMVLATIQVATAIITEATLSFLGVGAPPTSPSLGTLIRIGNDYLFSGEWWITVFPGVMLVLIALSVNLLGDWLRDALNPRLR